MAQQPHRVSLFATCLVDQFYPEVAEATVQVLERLGLAVDFPQAQTCCGQPAFNTGFHKDARAVARRFLDAFQDSECIVAPSGSCAAMVRVFYHELFRDDPPEQQRAKEVGSRLYELSEFLTGVLGVADVGASYSGKVAYHAPCHLLRELRVTEAPRQLIRGVRGAEYVVMDREEDCCGFGGMFAVKYPRISQAILEDKLQSLQESGAETLVSCDASCLMHIAGAMSRRGIPVRPLHLAQLLASREEA